MLRSFTLELELPITDLKDRNTPGQEAIPVKILRVVANPFYIQYI